eukprot:5835345-Pyramimonas_sp.AAC.1
MMYGMGAATVPASSSSPSRALATGEPMRHSYTQPNVRMTSPRKNQSQHRSKYHSQANQFRKTGKK